MQKLDNNLLNERTGENYDTVRSLQSIEEWGKWAKQDKRKNKMLNPYESDYLMSMFGQSFNTKLKNIKVERCYQFKVS